MSISKPHILVVGVGSIGKVHAQNGACFGHVSVVDHNASLAAQIARDTGATCFGNDLDAALAARPDGVVVAIPNKWHASVAKQAVDAGIPVLVEKPLSSDIEEAEALLASVRQNQQKLFVVSNMRFHPAIKTLATNLQSIGRPLFARAHYGNYLPNMRQGVDYRQLYVAGKDEGGVVLDGIHELDYLSWLLGPVAHISGSVGRISDLEIDAEDYAGLCLQHENGVRSELHLDFLRPHKRRGCEIVGTEAILDWQSDGKNPEICVVRRLTEGGVTTLYESDQLDVAAPHRMLMQHFIQAINDEPHDLQSGDEGMRLLNLSMSVRGI